LTEPSRQIAIAVLANFDFLKAAGVELQIADHPSTQVTNLHEVLFGKVERHSFACGIKRILRTYAGLLCTKLYNLNGGDWLTRGVGTEKARGSCCLRPYE
jgi:hypothetical protein